MRVILRGNHKTLILIFVSILSFEQISCSSWRAVDKDSFLEDEGHPRIRIKLVDDTIIESNNYYLTNDTLVIVSQKTPFYKAKDRLILVEDIKEIQTDHIDPNETIMVGVLFTAAILLFIEYVTGLQEAFSGLVGKIFCNPNRRTSYEIHIKPEFFAYLASYSACFEVNLERGRGKSKLEV